MVHRSLETVAISFGCRISGQQRGEEQRLAAAARFHGRLQLSALQQKLPIMVDVRFADNGRGIMNASSGFTFATLLIRCKVLG
jgi:hypothetical protein